MLCTKVVNITPLFIWQADVPLGQTKAWEKLLQLQNLYALSEFHTPYIHICTSAYCYCYQEAVPRPTKVSLQGKFWWYANVHFYKDMQGKTVSYERTTSLLKRLHWPPLRTNRNLIQNRDTEAHSFNLANLESPSGREGHPNVTVLQKGENTVSFKRTPNSLLKYISFLEPRDNSPE